MASTKTSFLLLVCILLALVLLVSSDATPDVHKTEANDLEESKYRGRGYGGRGPGYGGGRHRGGGGGGRGGNRGRGCPYGCCRRYRYSNDCGKCCRDANEAPDAFFADDVKN